MKLHLNISAGFNAVTGHGLGFVVVNQQRIETSLILMADKLITPWAVAGLAGLTLADFAPLIDLNPELVVFGAGQSFQFPDRRIMAAFSAARIGFETMDTPAACRTYNVLVGEGRDVAAALLVNASRWR